MYTNILIPVLADEAHDNHASFQAAQKLATVGAKFTILHVMEPIPSFVKAEIPDEILEKTHHEIEGAMARMSQSLLGSETKVLSGHAGRSIIDYANENGVDCIIVASHKPGIADFVLGSTAARVVRHAKCSVHVTR